MPQPRGEEAVGMVCPACHKEVTFTGTTRRTMMPVCKERGCGFSAPAIVFIEEWYKAEERKKKEQGKRK